MSYHLFSKKQLLSRKDHKCAWCGELIVKGQLYVFERSIYDGRYQNHRWHPECNEAAEQEAKRGECEFDLYENDRPPHVLSVVEAQAKMQAAPIDTRRRKLAMGYLHVAQARVTFGDSISDTETIVCDLLADLMHVCEKEGLSISDCVDHAMEDYAAEREELPE